MDDRQILLRKEWDYCAESFAYFFRHYWKVVLPQRGLIHVDVRPPQLEAAELFQNNRRVVVLKARQIGWSTLVTAYIFWLAFFHEHKSIAVLSRREDPEAILIITNAKLGYDNLPLWMRRRGPKITNDHQTKIVLSNLSTIESDASKDNPVRGRTLDCLVLDEFGKFPNPDQAWGSALPATEYGQLFVIGNANYYGSRFHKLYIGAKTKANDFISRFYPWNIEGIGHRNREWLANETSSMTPAERAAEHPEDDEECWVEAGTPVFDVEVIKEFPVAEPQIGIFDGERFIETPNGWLQLWAAPQSGRQYVCGADTARGLIHGDYSAAIIADSTGQHVASIRSHLKPTAYAFALNAVGRWYNNAFMGVESNKDGAAVLDTLVDELYYPNLYKTEVFNEVYERVVVKYGWYTGDQTKPLAISQFNDALVHGRFVTASAELVGEVMAYRYLGDGKMGGAPHDDLVMGGSICNQMLKHLSDPVSVLDEDAEDRRPPVSKFEGFNGTYHGHARMGLTPEEVDDLDGHAVIVMNRDAGMMRRMW